jgi:hypothetical protein
MKRRTTTQRNTVHPKGSRGVWDVFLSHSSRDKPRARRLAEQLRSRGLLVWMDEFEISPGDDIVSKIDHGLSNSRRVLVLISGSSLESGWCRAEYSHLLQLHIRTKANSVLVVQFSDVDIGAKSPLLASLHRIDLRTHGDFERLVAAINCPISVDDYCGIVSKSPLIDKGFGSGEVVVEPNDLLPVVLREMVCEGAASLRMVRSKQGQVTLPDLVRSAAKTGSGRTLVLLGEAGIGKTTIAKLVRRHLVEAKYVANVLPILLELGFWDSKVESIDQFADGELGFASLASLLTAKSSRRRVVLIIDGLNEQPDISAAKVLAYCHRLIAGHSATVVITTRPVTSADRLSRMANLHVYEMKRWTEEQVTNYFTNNRSRHILDQLPKESRGPLKLPLLSSLVLRTMLQETQTSSVGVVEDVFRYIVDQFREAFGGSQKSVGMRRASKSLRSDVWAGLASLAFEMTKAHLVQVEGYLLETNLPPQARKSIKPVTAELVSSGFLRCSNSVVALSPDVRLSELRLLKFAFLHQTLQEYLSALHMSRNLHELPDDISHDAFWREIPIYLARMGDLGDKKALIQSFIDKPKPDYLTATRLVGEIDDPAERNRLRRDLAARLISNIETQGLYAY